MKVLQSNKSNFNQSRLISVPQAALNDGQTRLKVERFSFTANNITYAVLGDMLNYWSFFPGLNEDGSDASEQWGQIPVWGFANVAESKHPDVSVGERYFGYFPPAEEVVMQPANVKGGSFLDASAHRAELPISYNLYRQAPASSDTRADNERSLLYPLFVTAYCIHDLMDARNWWNAEQIVIISASSKTSIGVAYALNKDKTSPKTIGMTSPRNLEAVKALGLYGEALDYQHINDLDANLATAIVDMSGNKSLLAELHQHLGDNMKFTLNVGITHWDQISGNDGINLQRCEQFFAPGHIQDMIKRIGQQALQQQSEQFIVESALQTRNWMKVDELDGIEGLMQHYADVCQGTVDSNTGLMVVMN